ncbi:hypothetical protein H0G86_008039 [Trichoderma simmonsii]|uniref:Uncharacterized protein n=1 Tax=Trichoderma simmonsii TaxID=1491479 RepID=A0A8G0PGZ3_9HYPO|nr:hypothetical protein H0G86_008039 [Trichoderma simmonsii]
MSVPSKRSMSSSDKTQATAPDDPAKPILVNGTWPEEWKDDPENRGANIARALADIERRSAYWESLGVPCARVSADKSKLVPIQYPNPDPLSLKQTGDRLDTQYITLTRKSLPGQHNESTCYVIKDGEEVGVDYVIVPKEEVAAREAQGWEV